MKRRFFRAATEIGFIVFLFYSNLLMGEFTHSSMRRGKDFLWAVKDIFTETNMGIALVAALIGFLIFQFLREQL